MQIPPAPLPAVVLVNQVQVMGPAGPTMQVMLKVNDMTGDRYVFFSPESAVQIGEQMVAAGTTSSSGLYVPPGTRMHVDVEEPAPPNRQQRRQAEREARRAEKQSEPEPEAETTPGGLVLP